ncbi:polysaccharide lyase family 1 protein [Streptomyces chitinivorans]|uniref:Polysaccharide lyase family 1 protein n=1 Tax=Streptomyces chitinivorans TaxID=1257027 RepID=A0ABW7HU73_9ACTN|nr:pectate lyase [Streptomyces chitinivorans]MDH2410813.1 pectate lyase [Streptomyces chitinivorans]
MQRKVCQARVIALTGCASLALAALAVPAQAAPRHGGDQARAVLSKNDGWASAEGGTTGGAAADADHVFTVTNRAELAAALNDGDDTPKIIKVKGTVHGNADDQGRPLTCEDYQRDGYTPEKYLQAYDPAVWGEREPSGPMEEARAASAAEQEKRVKLDVGSNTTLIGVGEDATILGASLQIRGVENVIVRNITFEDTYDCFPQWDPTDGESGAWNSEYDNVVVHGSRHVWIDHNTFTDGRRPDSEQPRYFGQLFQQHDGLLDIVRGADLVTVSWNVFTEHDKTILLGNSDKAEADDRGKLRTTFHHNLFEDVNERAPRVRFGQVDAYNNHFKQNEGAKYGYTWGIGKEAALVAEHNAFTLHKGLTPADTIRQWTPGTSMTERNNWVNGRYVDLLGAYNAANPDRLLGDDAGWTPALRTRVHHPLAVPYLVDRYAGAGEIKVKDGKGRR